MRFIFGDLVKSTVLCSFLAYRSKHPLVARYHIRHDQAVRDYYADHALQQTSWIDPRYYDFVRTLPYEDRIDFNMQGDPTTRALPTTVPPDLQADPAAANNNWGCPLFNAYIMCTNVHCPHSIRTTTMECPYRLCPNCCKHPNCDYHRRGTAAPTPAPVVPRPDIYIAPRSNPSTVLNPLQTQMPLPVAPVPVPIPGTGSGGYINDNNSNFAATFPQRRDALRRELARLHPPEPENYREKTKLKMFVTRKNVMEDSFRIVMTTRAEYLKLRLWVAFDGEEGVDYGGLTREWYLMLLPAITDPNYGLFMPSPSNSYVYQINPLSSVNPDHLQYFRFTGRILGMALFDNHFVETFFSPVFYKQLLGLPLTLRDMEYYDNEFFRSLLYLRENEGVEELGLYFTITEEEFGVVTERELIPGGASKAVTDRNKEEYIRYMLTDKLCMNTAEQMASIKRGFHDLIPEDLFVKIPFSAPELEMLICGISTIDSADWQRNTEYGGNYGQNSPQIVWFWEIVRNMTNEERARLLQFVTGTTKLPHGGFSQLVGSTGPRRFQIIKNTRTKDYLPTAHTCFNQLELPEYKTKGELNEKLRKAMDYAQKTFDLM